MVKEHIEKHWFKGGIVAALLLAVFLGNNYLQEQSELAREKQDLEKAQDDREFDAKQKESCLAIYKQESSKWNNVNGWRYNETEDKCYIEYKASPKKTEAQCDAQYKGSDGNVIPLLFMDWLLCKDGLFEKSF